MFREYLFAQKHGHKIFSRENSLQNTTDKATFF